MTALDLGTVSRLRASAAGLLVALTLAALLLLAGALRIAGAVGSLWLDEIWSMQNLIGLHHAGEIFWRISQDNNHFLNSLWLWGVGPDAPPIAWRALSIAFGIGTVAFAARIGVREAGASGAIIAALLFAISQPFVHYGSEARGYAGMVFALLWAWDALARFLVDPQRDAPRLEFAAAVALGSLCQVTMLPAAAMLCAGTMVLLMGGPTPRVAAAFRLAIAGILGAAPALLAIGAGILTTGVIRLGDQHAFTYSGWCEGLGGIVRATLGLPTAIPATMALFFGALVVILGLRAASHRMRAFCGAIICLPFIEAAAHLPNLHISRFHLAAALGLLLLAATMLADFWRRGDVGRIASAGLIALFIAGQTIQLSPFLQDGRGDYAAAVRTIGDKSYASDLETETGRAVRFFAHQQRSAPRQVKAGAFCDEPPAFFIAVDDDAHSAPVPSLRNVGPAGCQAPAQLVSTHPYSGLSGFRWSVYRLAKR